MMEDPPVQPPRSLYPSYQVLPQELLKFQQKTWRLGAQIILLQGRFTNTIMFGRRSYRLSQAGGNFKIYIKRCFCIRFLPAFQRPIQRKYLRLISSSENLFQKQQDLQQFSRLYLLHTFRKSSKWLFIYMG